METKAVTKIEEDCRNKLVKTFEEVMEIYKVLLLDLEPVNLQKTNRKLKNAYRVLEEAKDIIQDDYHMRLYRILLEIGKLLKAESLNGLSGILNIKIY